MGGGVGSIPHNAFSKMEKVEDLVEELRTNKIYIRQKVKNGLTTYWMQGSNKAMHIREMRVVLKYHESKMIYGRYVFIFTFSNYVLDCIS